MEKEILSLKQNLSEAQSIIKQNIDKPITDDDRDISITDLRAKVDQLTQENIELSQKVIILSYFNIKERMHQLLIFCLYILTCNLNYRYQNITLKEMSS
jgi:hypothetical protein